MVPANDVKIATLQIELKNLAEKIAILSTTLEEKIFPLISDIRNEQIKCKVSTEFRLGMLEGRIDKAESKLPEFETTKQSFSNMKAILLFAVTGAMSLGITIIGKIWK